MKWDTIKHIYHQVLVAGCKMKYLGGDKYRITHYFSNGNKDWEATYVDGSMEGRHTEYRKDGSKFWISISKGNNIKLFDFDSQGNIYNQREYQNGKQIK